MLNTNSKKQPLRGLLFPVDAPVEPVTLDPADVLGGLYRAIRCSTVEVVRLDVDVDLWCDEEALLADKPQPNRAWLVRRGEIGHDQAIFGNVVALSSTLDGETTSLTVDGAAMALGTIVGVSPALARHGDRQPHPAQIAAWICDGVDWRS